ncbi:MAG TPA: ABC transporter ATP-binding protein [Armatimonadota bacterium]|nr:ABC transporter ATP-binding protein [Armatimonadota bacterium]
MAVARVSLDRISYVYPDGQIALRDVSLEIPGGQTLGLLGSNGAGKSTLLLQVNGLLRGTGAVRVGEVQLNDRTLPEIRGKVGLVFQNPDDQLFMPTVYEDVAFGPRSQGLKPDEVRARVDAALRVVEMQASAERPPHHLSLGQKKRVALATVLAMDCEVLVLDEPTAGLDPRGRRELAVFLASLEQTQIIATHDLEFAVELCDQVAVLHAGEVVAQGPPRAVLSDAALMERTGLEVPHSLRYHAAGIPHEHLASRGRVD